MTCSLCGGPMHRPPVPKAPFCPKCDRHVCPKCKTPEITGKAWACGQCGTPIPKIQVGR